MIYKQFTKGLSLIRGMLPRCMVFSELRCLLLLPLLLWPKTMSVWALLLAWQGVSSLTSVVLSWAAAVCVVHATQVCWQYWNHGRLGKDSSVGTAPSGHWNSSSNTPREQTTPNCATHPWRTIPKELLRRDRGNEGTHRQSGLLAWGSFSDDDDDHDDDISWEDGSVQSEDISWSDLAAESTQQRQEQQPQERIVILWPRSSNSCEVRERLPSCLDIASLYEPMEDKETIPITPSS